MSKLKVSPLPLSGLYGIERQCFTDQRGFFCRLFSADELAATGWQKPVRQINHSYTAKSGVVRGLHYQKPPHAEMKLVSCIRGSVWDVVVDLRIDSPTYLRWHAAVLSAENSQALLIPEGFAHGFQTLVENTELLYCHSENYHPESEAGLHPLDPFLAIPWPRPVSELSDRDAQHAYISADFAGGHQ